MQQQIVELNKAFQEKPRDADARFLLAWAVITTNGMNTMAIEIFKSCFDANQVDVPLEELNPSKGFLAAHLVGRFTKEQKDSATAQKFLQLAYNISKDKMSPNRDVGEVCTHLQLGTDLDSYPMSNKDVDESVSNLELWATKLIDLYTVVKHKDVYLNAEWLGRSMPGFASDPYVHCVLTLFPLSFYFRADVAKIASLHYQLAALAFPRLLYTAKHVEDFEKEQQQQQQKQQIAKSDNDKTDDASPAAKQLFQKCVDRKIKLGVISSTFSENHSVSEDFGGILQRLDRNLFDVTYHYLHENTSPREFAAFLTANPTDKLFHYEKRNDETNDGAWVRRFGEEIEEFQLDVILYLDLTMSTFTRRLGMERLAPVQINTHGHPLTSGIPKETMQHFVSWAEAELPIEESRTHYTEELQLIPKGKIHQYYTPRLATGPNGRRISRVTKMPFDHLTRDAFGELPANIRNSSPDDDDIHIYVCMQKPFKVFPEFDELLCGILGDDPKGHAILHKETQTGHTDKFIQRLKTAGCDMDRVHFVSPQPAHMLMALYNTATVLLDSYPAGGCTTTREALELGKAVVTWPARLLGGRWTLGLYNTIGLDANAQTRVIADSKEEYIAKAIELGTNKKLRQDVEKHIIEAVPNLFGREEAVEEWEKIILRVSPVKHCNNDNNDEKASEIKDEL
jgi:predicted O-linked N-acetylglucosamine transferase (SPINDLY family)